VPAQLAMIYVAGSYWCTGPLGPAGRVGLAITTGMFSAMFGITIAHELIHRRQRLDRAVGGALLSTVCFGTFKIVHLSVHHRFVGTARDFATARRGQSIYRFWGEALAGNVREALRCDRDWRGRRGLPVWRSELLAWYGLTGIFLAISILAGGWRGALFFLAQSLVAVLQLECINYLQHYGLTRGTAADGRPEAVGSGHAWSQGLVLHDLLLINLPRHADHHLHPRRSYEGLRHDRQAPQYPHNYALMILLLLVPPLFRRVVHPVLDRFQTQLAAA
jgi:alkane 1-monooxygenase